MLRIFQRYDFKKDPYERLAKEVFMSHDAEGRVTAESVVFGKTSSLSPGPKERTAREALVGSGIEINVYAKGSDVNKRRADLWPRHCGKPQHRRCSLTNWRES